MKSITIKSIDGIHLDAAIHPAKCTRSLGTVIQAHGITVDMDEGGMFVRLAESLASSGFDVLRFSFRGHGKSGGTQRGMTIAGEMLDLEAVVEYATKSFPAPLSIVSASFGAVSTCLLLDYLRDKLRGLVLWNPVLDLRKTFVHPTLPWGRQNFGKDSFQQLETRGYLLLDGTFETGRVLYEEMKRYNPYECFISSPVSSIIIHGDKDTYVPYDVSRVACQRHVNCNLFTIEGSDHGFDSKKREDTAIAITVEWLESIYPGVKS